MLKLNKDFGETEEIKGVNGELSLQLPPFHFDKAAELPEEERADYYKSLQYKDYVNENGEITLIVTLDKKNPKDKKEVNELIFHRTPSNKVYEQAFANVKNKLFVVVDYTISNGIKGKTLTGMEQR